MASQTDNGRPHTQWHAEGSPGQRSDDGDGGVDDGVDSANSRGSSWSKIGSSSRSSSSEACGVPAREQMLKYYVYATLLLRLYLSLSLSLRFSAILRSNHNASSSSSSPSQLPLPPSSTSQTTATTMSSGMATCDLLLACG